MIILLCRVGIGYNGIDVNILVHMAKIKIEESEEHISSEPRRLKSVVIIFSLLLLFFAGAAGYFYYKYKKMAQTSDTKEEIAQLVKTLDAVIELPGGETPTLATVTDKEKLASQPFFRKSENGDKVLIYTNAGRAILYRPSIGKIVDITSINIQEDPTTAKAAPAEEQKVAPGEATQEPEAAMGESIKVAFLNGSAKIGVTQGAEDKILAAFPEGMTIVGKEKASKNTYQGVIVADISQKASARAAEIATVLGGTVGAFPVEELIPGQADIVIIIGNAGTSTNTSAQSNTKIDSSKSADLAPKDGTAIQQ